MTELFFYSVNCVTLVGFRMWVRTATVPAIMHPCLCLFKRTFTLACDYTFFCLFACVSAHVTYSISIEIKCSGSHKFTHSLCFDSVQSTVCIITPVPCGNLLGPKYCSLTNPSFVFSCYTKHQSCFSTHATHQPPPSHLKPTHKHTHTLAHHPCSSPLPRNTELRGTESWLIRTARHAGIGFDINIFLFQMALPTMWKETTTGPAGRDGLYNRGKDKMTGKIVIKLTNCISFRLKTYFRVFVTSVQFYG